MQLIDDDGLKVPDDDLQSAVTALLARTRYFCPNHDAHLKALFEAAQFFESTPLFCDGDRQLCQASAHLGFRTTTTLRLSRRTKCVCALRPDLRATYLDGAPKGRPTLWYVQAHIAKAAELPAMGADYESWPKGSRNWTDVANGYLNLVGATTVDRTAVGDAAECD